MKKILYISIIFLLLASLACSAVSTVVKPSPTAQPTQTPVLCGSWRYLGPVELGMAEELWVNGGTWNQLIGNELVYYENRNGIICFKVVPINNPPSLPITG